MGFFLTETSNAENKATVYLIFTLICLQELARGHPRYITDNRMVEICVILRLSYWHPYPPLPFKHF